MLGATSFVQAHVISLPRSDPRVQVERGRQRPMSRATHAGAVTPFQVAEKVTGRQSRGRLVSYFTLNGGNLGAALPFQGRGEICRWYQPEMRRRALAPAPRISSTRLPRDVLLEPDGLSANVVVLCLL